jgi:hypothetical protein
MSYNFLHYVWKIIHTNILMLLSTFHKTDKMEGSKHAWASILMTIHTFHLVTSW